MEAMHLYTFMNIILDFPNSDFQPIYPRPTNHGGFYCSSAYHLQHSTSDQPMILYLLTTPTSPHKFSLTKMRSLKCHHVDITKLYFSCGNKLWFTSLLYMYPFYTKCQHSYFVTYCKEYIRLCSLRTALHRNYECLEYLSRPCHHKYCQISLVYS
jgi:hypothetical protein